MKFGSLEGRMLSLRKLPLPYKPHKTFKPNN